MKKSIIISSAVVLAMALCSACTKNPDFTLDSIKDAVNEFTLFEEGVSLPVDTIVIFKMRDEIEGDDFKTDADSVLILESTGSFDSTSFEVPMMTIEKIYTSSEASSGKKVDITIPDEIKGKEIKNSSTISSVSTSVPLSISAALPENVTDVRDVEIELPAELTIASTSDLLQLKSGYKISFPKGIVIAKNEESSDYDVVNDNSIVMMKDIDLSTSKSFEIKITRLDIQQSWKNYDKTPKGIDLVKDNDVSFSGDLVVKAGDVPSSAYLTVKLDLDESVKVNSANVKINKSIKLEDHEFKVEMPSQFKNNAEIHIDNVKLSFNVDNISPVSYTVKGKVREKGKQCIDDISIKMDANTRIGYMDFKTNPNLRTVLGDLNEEKEIEFYELEVVAESDEFFEIKSATQYDAKCAYKVEVPMSFLNKTYFAVDTTIVTKIELSDAVRISGLECNFLITNGTEFSFELEAEANVDGKLVKLVTGASEDSRLIAGETKTVKLKVEAAAETLTKIDDFNIKATVRVDGEKASIRISDFIKVQLLSLTVPDGVSFNLEKTEK